MSSVKVAFLDFSLNKEKEKRKGMPNQGKANKGNRKKKRLWNFTVVWNAVPCMLTV